MMGWPGPAADLCFLVSAQGLSGSVTIEPCLGHFSLQLLELKILERFGNTGPFEHPTQDCISFGRQPILGKERVAFYAAHSQDSPYARRFVMATVRLIFCAGALPRVLS